MTITDYENILILAPHTDDGELGAGGTIARLTDQGKNVTYVAFSTARQSVPKDFPEDILKTEVTRATGVLGIPAGNLIIHDYEVRKLNYVRQEILEDLVRLRKTSRFDLVLMPSPHDIHQDHATIAQEAIRAFKNTTLLGYELPWNNLTFDSQCFVKLEKRHIDKKIEALKAYRSQKAKDYLSEDFIHALAKTRGVQAGHALAEAFEVIRLFL